MKMTLRWYGSGYDTVTLEQIRQIPGVHGVITTLYGALPGEVWQYEDGPEKGSGGSGALYRWHRER